MEPGVKDRDIMYKLIIGQLYHDGHKQLALDLSNSIGMNPSPPPSDKLFRLVSAAQLVEDDADEEKMDIDQQMTPNQVVSSIDNFSIDDKSRDYFPFLALLPELKALVFSFLSIKDRFALAAVNNCLNTIERESKYHVETLFIGENRIRAPALSVPKLHPNAQSIVFLKSQCFRLKYSSDCIRRIAHNASIGCFHIELNDSFEFHREVCNLIKEFDIRHLVLSLKNRDLDDDMMGESFVLDLARACKSMHIESKNFTPEIIHELYKIMLNGSTKLDKFSSFLKRDLCIAFFRLIGITYRDATFFSNREIEVYIREDEDEDVEKWCIFDGHLEMTLETDILQYEYERRYFRLIHHETPESLEEAKNEEGMERVEIVPE